MYAIRAHYTHLGNGDYRTNYEWWYISRPIISAVIGIFAYFLFAGGLMSVSNDPDPGKGILLYCGISFLAGYSMNQFLEKLKDLSKTLFTKNVSNVADEIKKLWDLKESGAIDQTQFDEQMKKLLEG